MIVKVDSKLFEVIAHSCSPPVCLGRVQIQAWASWLGIDEQHYYVGLCSEPQMFLHLAEQERVLVLPPWSRR